MSRLEFGMLLPGQGRIHGGVLGVKKPLLVIYKLTLDIMTLGAKQKKNFIMRKAPPRKNPGYALCPGKNYLNGHRTI